MSLELVRQVSRENPELLSTNLGRTCYRHTTILIEKLRAAGHEAYLICKSPGEGQYTPPGFERRTVTGLDGKTYVCSGVSHDAIWCDGEQVDTIGSANEHDRPIYRRNGDPNWSFDPSDGPQITASPVWNEIPAQFWRNNNPPLKGDAPVPFPVPPQPPAPVLAPALPDRGELMREMAFLHEFYKTDLLRADGLWIDGHPDFEGIAAWVLDVYLASRIAGRTPERSRQLYIDAIRNSNEWKGKHPGETP